MQIRQVRTILIFLIYNILCIELNSMYQRQLEPVNHCCLPNQEHTCKTLFNVLQEPFINKSVSALKNINYIIEPNKVNCLALFCILEILSISIFTFPRSMSSSIPLLNLEIMDKLNILEPIKIIALIKGLVVEQAPRMYPLISLWLQEYMLDYFDKNKEDICSNEIENLCKLAVYAIYFILSTYLVELHMINQHYPTIKLQSIRNCSKDILTNFFETIKGDHIEVCDKEGTNKFEIFLAASNELNEKIHKETLNHVKKLMDSRINITQYFTDEYNQKEKQDLTRTAYATGIKSLIDSRFVNQRPIEIKFDNCDTILVTWALYPIISQKVLEQGAEGKLWAINITFMQLYAICMHRQGPFRANSDMLKRLFIDLIEPYFEKEEKFFGTKIKFEKYETGYILTLGPIN